MIYLNLDENNYLLSVASVGHGIPAEIDLSQYDLTGKRICAYKWENDTLIFDADRLAEIEAENEASAAMEQPTELEQLRADVDYIAVMSGIEL